jgi:hypothetical protein
MAGEGEGAQRAAIEPVGVIDDRQNRGPVRQVRQQCEYGDPGQQTVRSDRIRD